MAKHTYNPQSNPFDWAGLTGTSNFHEFDLGRSPIKALVPVSVNSFHSFLKRILARGISGGGRESRKRMVAV
jgi:hypothetical protein